MLEDYWMMISRFYDLLRCPALNEVLCGVEEGCRNDVAFRLSQYLSALDIPLFFCKHVNETISLSPDASFVYNFLKGWNTNNIPPLSENELRTCITQGLKLPCSYGKFGQGIFTKYPLKKYCDKHKDSCIVKKILKKCNAHEEAKQSTEAYS